MAAIFISFVKHINTRTMKILSYNVNGIRAALKKGFAGWLKEENPDVVGIQETKAQPEQIDNKIFEDLGYHCYWFSAKKKGYSGTGILSKKKAKHIERGIGIEKYDIEGRMIRADYEDFSFASIYHPSGSSGDLRQAYKMEWLEDFRKYVKQLKEKNKNIIFAGDYNICRLWYDIHNPEKQQKTSGFLPEEREWFQNLIEDGFCDTFRKFYPEEKDRYSWWSYRAGARKRNKGWRIDYHIVPVEFAAHIEDAFILTDAVHSDHCPVGIILK